MNEHDWKEHLDTKRGTPLYSIDGVAPLFKYQHVERMGSQAVEGLLDGDIVVQNKLDGANLTVATLGDGSSGIIVASRNKVVSLAGEPATGFNGAVQYVLAHEGIQAFLKRYRWILRGEWTVRHTLTYDPDTYGHLYVFDVQQNWDGAYVHPDKYIPILEEYGIRYIRILERLSNPTMDQLTALSQGPDEFGAKQKEGIVVKRYNFVNKYDRTVWGKVVTADFKVKNALAFQATKKEDIELRFAAIVDVPLVIKTIRKIKNEEEPDRDDHIVNIRDMSQILGRVWYDMITEELWDFVKKNNVDQFNFRKARRYVETAAREIALSFFNGTLEETP